MGLKQWRKYLVTCVLVTVYTAAASVFIQTRLGRRLFRGNDALFLLRNQTFAASLYMIQKAIKLLISHL